MAAIRRMNLWLGAAFALALASPVEARDTLGIFEGWGAFRDARPARCYAIAEPLGAQPRRDWRAFASVAHWPERGARNQLHVRLSRQRAEGAKVTLGIGSRSFELVAGEVDAWAPDVRTDAAIVAAMRSGSLMSVRTRSARGGWFTDRYRLRGAATAIDAAALGCARR